MTSMHAVPASARRRAIPPGVVGLALVAAIALPCVARAAWYWQEPYPQPETLFATALKGDRALAAGGNATMLGTIDGGATWTVLDTGIDLQANFGSVQIVADDFYIASAVSIDADGILRGVIVSSTNQGATWTPLLAVENAGTLSTTFRDTLHGIAVGIDANQFAPEAWTTEDGGASWSTQSLPVTGDFFAVAYAADGVATAVGGDFGTGTSLIERTENGGATWTRQTAPTDQVLNGVAFADADHGIAVGAAGTILTTDNGGATWTLVDGGTTLDLATVSYPALGAATVAGGDQRHVGIVLRSIDDGAEWTPTTTAQAIENVFFSDAANGRAVGFGGEILVTHNGGATWDEQFRTDIPAIGLNGVAFSGTRGVAVGSDGTIARTDDSFTWHTQASGTSLPLIAVAFEDADNVIAVGGDPFLGQGIILASGDGATWQDISPPDLRTPLYAISCPALGTCVAVGQCGIIIATGNGGESWTVQRPYDCAVQPDLLALDFPDPLDGTTGSLTGELLHTIDGGATWPAQDSPTGDPIRAIRFIDADNGFLSSGQSENTGALYATADGGASWHPRLQNSPLIIDAIDFSDALHGVAATTYDIVYRTADAGATWHPEHAGTGFWFGVAALGDGTTRLVGFMDDNAIVRAEDAPPLADGIFEDGFE